MLCITAAVPTCRAAAYILNVINQPVLCRICPRPPRLKRRTLLVPEGIFQTTVGYSITLYDVMGISPRCGSHKAAPIASKKILWKHIQISAVQIVKRDLHSVSLCVSSKDYLLLWLGGSIIIPLHISWRIGCHTDFRSYSYSLGL